MRYSDVSTSLLGGCASCSKNWHSSGSRATLLRLAVITNTINTIKNVDFDPFIWYTTPGC